MLIWTMQSDDEKTLRNKLVLTTSSGKVLHLDLEDGVNINNVMSSVLIIFVMVGCASEFRMGEEGYNQTIKNGFDMLSATTGATLSENPSEVIPYQVEAHNSNDYVISKIEHYTAYGVRSILKPDYTY